VHGKPTSYLIALPPSCSLVNLSTFSIAKFNDNPAMSSTTHSSHLFNMDPALLCKIFFNLGTAVNLGGTLIPSFRTQIMNYGSRNTSPSLQAISPRPQSFHSTMFDLVASAQVPHTWFIHYYIVSVLSSLFWGFQLFTRGTVFQFMSSYTQQSTSSMTVNQVVLAWIFMTLQGVRRLFECSTLTKPSQAKMWIGIWAIGMIYYVFMGIAVWIEGSGTYSIIRAGFQSLSLQSP